MAALAKTLAPRVARSRIGQVQLRLHHNDPTGLPPNLPSKDDIAEAFQRALAELGAAQDDTYWVIQRVDLQFSAESERGAQGIAEALSVAMKTALRRVLAGQNVAGVRRYSRRAAWLSACLWAVHTGTLGEAWPFARYRHLAALPQADQARLMIQREGPELVWAALEILEKNSQLRPFAVRLGARAVQGVLRLILPAAAPSPKEHEQHLSVLVHQLSQPGQPGIVAVLRALAQQVAQSSRAPLPAASEIGALLAAAQRRPKPGAVSRPPLPMAQKDAAHRSVHGSEGHLALHDENKPPARHKTTCLDPASGDTLETRFAGVFVLWRSVLALDLLPLLPDGPARLTLAATLAGPDFHAAWDDAGLHWLTGYAPEEGEDPPPAFAGLAAQFRDHYQDWRLPVPVEPVLCRVGKAWLLQDRSTEDWLHLGSRRAALRAAQRLDGPPKEPRQGARDPAVDLAWFLDARRIARRPFILLARAAFGDFGRRLHGLERASAAWLWERLLAGGGQLVFDETPALCLPSVPLDLVLRMGGLDGHQIDTAQGPLRLLMPGPR